MKSALDKSPKRADFVVRYELVESTAILPCALVQLTKLFAAISFDLRTERILVDFDMVDIMLHLPPTSLEFGALNVAPSASVSRTIMVPELMLLLDAVDQAAPYDAYLHAAIAENALLKPSLDSRRKSIACLRDRYALDPKTPLFRALRRLAAFEPEALPQLALLTAAARDPLLRATFPLLIERPVGAEVTTADFAHAIGAALPDRFSPITLKAAAERMRASWKQSGHLAGPTQRRLRAQPPISPASIALGLLIGDACGLGGESLLGSQWIAIQGATPSAARAYAQTAAKRGWIELRDAGGVLDVTFRTLLAPENRSR